MLEVIHSIGMVATEYINKWIKWKPKEVKVVKEVKLEKLGGFIRKNNWPKLK
jgi:hypothetical protein